MIWIFLVGAMCPTLYFAVFMKYGSNKNKVIRSLNWGYFVVALVSFIILVVRLELNQYETNKLELTPNSFWWTLWVVFLLSRCFEIFYAFLRDGLDKISINKFPDRKEFQKTILLCNKVLSYFCSDEIFYKIKLNIKKPRIFKIWLLSRLPLKNKVKGEKLTNYDRLVLSFRSYFELILNFAIMFSLLPASYWNVGKSLDIIKATYFSGVTITTLGYGDVYPTQWFSQFLSVFEVLCGFTLIVICLAIYLKDDN
ncbi:potassium channel family protein [Vibrio cyclitrophicus]|uniref:potassium channel family protein n=1 Tax=Vibrio cyclitrophicus TaxID=47951 RepID=UPI00080D9801|nr:potassium channel family protein [Vibrio cyclitrophicus]OCH38437.1 hypothetical protein A6E07_01920 [Vibrio cyclitrophicus]